MRNKLDCSAPYDMIAMSRYLCLQNQVASAEGLCEDDVLLYCGGVPLEDASVLSECVANMATVEVLSRLLGGKTLPIFSFVSIFSKENLKD